MIAKERVYHDGVWYEPGQEIWDLGSFSATRVEGSVRHYIGLSADAPAKLPHYVGNNSDAYCVDNGDYYIYLKSTDTWYKQ